MGVPARKGALGRKDYYRYIRSSAWRKKKQQYIDSKLSNDCHGCGAIYRKGFHLHHKTYKNLGVERLMDLVMVCPDCHDEIHLVKVKDLWKRTNKVLKAKRKQRNLK